jgi:hypothetical protein
MYSSSPAVGKNTKPPRTPTGLTCLSLILCEIILQKYIKYSGMTLLSYTFLFFEIAIITNKVIKNG